MFFYCLIVIINKMDMEIAASIMGANKDYKAGDTLITTLQSTTFDFNKKELTFIIVTSGSGKITQGHFRHPYTICDDNYLKTLILKIVSLEKTI